MRTDCTASTTFCDSGPKNALHSCPPSGSKHDVRHGGGGLAVGVAGLFKAKLRESIVELDARSASGLPLAEPFGQHGMFNVREHSVLANAKAVGMGRHKKSLHGFVPNTHLEGWRPTVALAGHIVVPPLPV